MGGVVRRARGRSRGAALGAVLLLGVAGSLWSAAANLVDGDSGGAVDVFVRDREEDGSWRTTLVSSSVEGKPGNADSYAPSISADGDVVAFASEATNLDGGGGVGHPDVFLWHRDSKRVTRISRGLLGGLADGGSYSPSISADGSVVAFASDAADLVMGDLNGLTDVFVWKRDPVTRLVSLVRVVTRLLGEPKGNSYQPSVSADGTVVAFASDAPNLVADDDNDTIDVFAYDRSEGTTTLVSKGAGGKAADGPSFFPAVSGRGERVAFVSMAADLGPADGNGGEDVFVRDTETGATVEVPLDAAGGQGEQGFCPGISPDGEYVAFAVVPPDFASTQYYLHGPLLAGDPGGTPPVETETSTTAGTTTTEAPPTSTEPAVTETTGG